MTTDSGGEPLRQRLEEVARRVYPSRYVDYGQARARALLQAIAAMDNSVTSELNVQKFTDVLRATYVPVLGPKPLYLGGRWSFADHRTLEEMVDVGVLSRHPSPVSGLDAPVYSICEDTVGDVWTPDAWRREFHEFKRTFDLKNIFDDHDRRVVKPFVVDSDRYVARDRNLFEQARHGDLDVHVEAVRDDVSYTTPMKVRRVDDVHRPFAATAYHLVEEYKQIPAPGVRERNAASYRHARRKFSVPYILQDHDDGVDVSGELVLLVGYFEDPVAGADTWLFREEPAADANIPVRFDGQPDVDDAHLSNHSIGVLGFLDARSGEPVVRAFALLDSGELPHHVLREQRGRMIERVSDAVPDLLDDHDDIKSGQDQLRSGQAEIAAAVEKLISDADLSDDQRNAVRELVTTLGETLDWANRLQVLAEFAENHPELEWIVTETLKHIS